MVNTGTWLRNLVHIKETNKQAKVYVGRYFRLHTFCLKLMDMDELHNHIASIG